MLDYIMLYFSSVVGINILMYLDNDVVWDLQQAMSFSLMWLIALFIIKKYI